MILNDTSQDGPTARFWVAARVSSKKWCLFQLISLGGQPMQAAGNSRLPAWTDRWSSGVTFRGQVKENARPERNLDRVSNLLAMEFRGDKSSHLSWHSWKRHLPPPISTPNWDGLQEYSLRAKAFIQKEDSWAGEKLTQIESVWVFKDQSEFDWWVHWKFLVSWPDPPCPGQCCHPHAVSVGCSYLQRSSLGAAATVSPLEWTSPTQVAVCCQWLINMGVQLQGGAMQAAELPRLRFDNWTHIFA